MQFLYIIPQKRENDEDGQRPNDACSGKNTEGDRKALLRARHAEKAVVSHHAAAHHEAIVFSLTEPLHFVLVADAVGSKYGHDRSDQPVNKKTGCVEILNI